MLFLFYMTLHALQNLFAELTRFADREFYKVHYFHLNKRNLYIFFSLGLVVQRGYHSVLKNLERVGLQLVVYIHLQGYLRKRLSKQDSGKAVSVASVSGFT